MISAREPPLPHRPGYIARHIQEGPSIAPTSTHPTVDYVGSSFGQRQVGKVMPAASQPSGSAIFSGPAIRAAATPAGVAAAGTGVAQKPGVTKMEERLLAMIDLAPETIRGLAQQRAEVVRVRIVEAAQVDPARLFLVEGSERAKKEGGGRVYFTLK